MEKTEAGTPVGVDDPYAHAGVCDHLTDEGRCRLGLERRTDDRHFLAALLADDCQCVLADQAEETVPWAECPHYRCRDREPTCERCGLAEHRNAHGDDRPLLEEHHLAYPDGETGHEITVVLCRWCHAKVHDSWARIDDEVEPDPAALAEQEARRSREIAELSFETAAERFDDD